MDIDGDSRAVRVVIFTKNKVYTEWLERCPRANKVRQDESQANRLEQLHQMTVFLDHFNWILKHEQGITVQQRGRAGASEGQRKCARRDLGMLFKYTFEGDALARDLEGKPEGKDKSEIMSQRPREDSG